MKKFLSLFFMSLACVPLSVVAQTADDEGTEAITYQFEQVETICNPKAYIHVKIEPGATALYSDANAKFTRATLRNASSLSYIEDGSEVETQLPYTRFFADYDLANGVITYFVYDNLYIPSKSTIKLTLPVVCAKYADDVVRTYKGETISLTVADAVYLSESCYSSSVTVDKNQTLIIKKSSVLTVDNDLEIANLIVEAGDESSYGAGVIVNNGASLAIADTAYFLCHNKFHRNNPYLINNGSYTAAASIFTKSVDNSLNLDYATKYGYLNNGNLATPDFVTPSISYPVQVPNKRFAFCNEGYMRVSQQNIRDYLGSSAQRYYYNYKSPWLVNEYSFSRKSLQYTVMGDEAIFRANGEINDEDEYEILLVNEFSGKEVGKTNCVLNNPYQACIDWSAVIADQPELVEKLRNVTIGAGVYHNSWSYNFYSGLTTYDGPMQFGYLQPIMEPAQFYTLGETSGSSVGEAETIVPDDITVKVGKKYLTSYKEFESYGCNVTVPYVRFYVDDPDCPKGVGNRSVYVAYFLPAEEYEYEGTEFYNPIINGNKLYDVLSANENEYVAKVIGCRSYFPFVGSRPPIQGVFQRVHVWTLPEKGNQIDFPDDFMTIAVDQSQQRVEFGILDYGNFNGITLKFGPLMIDCQVPANNVLKSVMSLRGGELDGNFELKTNKYYWRHPANYLVLGSESTAYLSNINHVPSSINGAEESLAAVEIYSNQGEIIVNAEEKCTTSVYNVNGVLVATFESEGTVSFSVGTGLFITHVANAKGVTVKKVLVK